MYGLEEENKNNVFQFDLERDIRANPDKKKEILDKIEKNIKEIKTILREGGKDKKDLDKFNNLKGEEGEAETIKKSRSLPPLVPFDLTSLQREAYKFHNFSPSRTLQVAQSLYLAGLISYPRTSSQHIPEAISPKEII